MSRNAAPGLMHDDKAKRADKLLSALLMQEPNQGYLSLPNKNVVFIVILQKTEILMPGHLAPGGHILLNAVVIRLDFEQLSRFQFIDFIGGLEYRHRAGKSYAVKHHIRRNILQIHLHTPNGNAL
jgi:hypothetical protein